MPIVFCTSFHGLDVPDRIPGLWTNGSASTLSNANIITRYFGMGDATTSNRFNGGDAFKAIFALVTESIGTHASCSSHVSVGISSFDPKSKALVGTHYKVTISGYMTSVGNGPMLDLRSAFAYGAGNLKYIIGFRLGSVPCPGASIANSVALVGLNASGTRGTFATLSILSGDAMENYIELVVEELTPTAAKISVYMNDKLVTEVSNTVYYRAVGVARIINAVASNTLYPLNVFNRNLEIRDLYIMEVKGKNDLRIGSTASVVKLDIDSDSAAEFRRPDGFASNASVAAGDITVMDPNGRNNGAMEPKNPDQLLVGDEVGQQDLYNLDISSATSTLGSVDAVSIRSVAMTPGAASRSFSAIARSGANQVSSPNGPTVLGQGNEYQVDNLVLNSDPADDARWNLTKLASLKVGTKLVS